MEHIHLSWPAVPGESRRKDLKREKIFEVNEVLDEKAACARLEKVGELEFSMKR
jgi:hypothetical protein